MITVLLSGGVDSAVLLEKALQTNEVRAVFVDYGQDAWLEESRAAALLCANRCRLLMSRVRLDAQSMNIGTGEAGPRIVPNRNLVLLGIAANLAPESDEIWFGATAADHEYRDCSEQFAIHATLALGITVKTPLARLTRTEVRALGEQLGAPMHLCWSCYQPDRSRGWAYPAVPCGTCNSCMQDPAKIALADPEADPAS